MTLALVAFGFLAATLFGWGWSNYRRGGSETPCVVGMAALAADLFALWVQHIVS